MYDNLTKSDIQKMEEEIEHRKLVVRKETIQAVKEARAFGDLSENFEYYAAKQAKNQNESRIRYLENMIKTANIIEDNSADDEVVRVKEVEFTPLTEEEVSRMLSGGSAVKIDLAVGDQVRILSGTLEDFVGTVEEVNTATQIVRVRVEMFGRETPVELEVCQVERV